jgi:hypothetical protein
MTQDMTQEPLRTAGLLAGCSAGVHARTFTAQPPTPAPTGHELQARPPRQAPRRSHPSSSAP